MDRSLFQESQTRGAIIGTPVAHMRETFAVARRERGEEVVQPGIKIGRT